MSYLTYVAIGDSCAEGLDDPYPDGTGFRGFADLTATRLAELEPDLRYANLAVRGRRLDQILTEQVPRAVRLRPDLVTLFGVLWGIVIFGEQHSAWVWLSLATMMAAVALVTPRKSASVASSPATTSQ